MSSREPVDPSLSRRAHLPDRLVRALEAVPLRERLGIGTVANAIWVGVSIDLGMLVLPEASSLPVAIALMLLGVVVNATRSTPFIILVVAIVPLTRLPSAMALLPAMLPGLEREHLPWQRGSHLLVARTREEHGRGVVESLVEAGLVRRV